MALANTGGGVIVFGVNDQLRVEGVDDPEGVRKSLSKSVAKKFNRHLFLSSIASPLTTDGGLSHSMLMASGVRTAHVTVVFICALALKREKRHVKSFPRSWTKHGPCVTKTFRPWGDDQRYR